MAQKTLVAETDHVIAVQQDVGGDTVIVTFNEMGFARNGLRFWGDDFLLKQGISALGVVTSRPNWYPRAAMDEILPAILERTRGRNLITYGHSQGAYGALKFSAALKASAALAFCPQWSIDPADVASFDTRFVNFFDPALANGLRIEQEDLCPNSFIFFDRTERSDRSHAEKLAGYRGVKTVLAPFTRHDAIHLATEARSAAKLISLCTREAAPAVTDLRQVIRNARRNSNTYYGHMIRQLIARMSRSRRHPTLFASRYLAGLPDANPFYTALIAHAKGDAELARAELARATPGEFNRAELVSCWRLANTLRFTDGELAMAEQICKAPATNIFTCFYALSTFIRAGKMAVARREIAQLAKHADAMNHIGQFVDYSLKLRTPEIIDGFISLEQPPAARAPFLLRLADFCARLGDRPHAFRALMELEKSAAESPAHQRQIAAGFVKIGECSIAMKILQGLLRAAPTDRGLALAVVEAMIPLNKERALIDLRDIMREPDLPTALWVRASHLYQSLEDNNAALHAISTAAGRPDSGIVERQRLAVMLVNMRLKRRARAELAALLGDCSEDPRRLRFLGELAYRLRDRRLTLRFAESQFECDRTNPDGILYLAHRLRIAGNRDRALQLLSGLLKVERRSPSISDQQWVALAEELYGAGDAALTKEAVAEVKARDPHNSVARRLTAMTNLADKFGKRAPMDGRTSRSAGLMARLQGLFRW